MIKPEYISGKNYITYSSFKLPLLNQGLVRIRGINYDSSSGGDASNGAGKSILLEALQHVLYGDSSRGTKKKDLVRGTGLKLELALKAAKHRYVFKRFRSHKKHKNSIFIFEDGEDITPKGSQEVQKKIRSIIGSTREEFCNHTYLSPKVSHIFLDGKPQEKLQYLAQLFELDNYDKLKKAAEKFLQEVRDKVIAFGSIEETLANFKKHMKVAIPTKKIKKRLLKTEKTLKALESDQKNLTSKFSELSEKELMVQQKSLLTELIVDSKLDLNNFRSVGDLKDLRKSLLEVKSTIESTLSLNQEASATQKQKNELSIAIKKLKEELPKNKGDSSVDSLKNKIRSLEKKESEYSEDLRVAKKRKSLRDELKELCHEGKVSDKESLEKEHEALLRKIALIEAKYSLVLKEIKTLSPLLKLESPVCPTCKQDVNLKFISSSIKKATERREKLLSIKTRQTSSLASLMEKIAKEEQKIRLQKELQQLPKVNSIKELSADLIKVGGEVEKLQEWKEVQEEKALLSKQFAAIGNTEDPMAEEQVEKLKRKLSSTIQKLGVLKTVCSSPYVSQLFSKSSGLKELKKQKRVIKERLEDLNKQTRTAEGKIAKYQASLEQGRKNRQVLKEMKEQLDQMSEVQKQKEATELLIAYCKYAKERKLKEVCQVFNESLSDLASVLFTERGLEFVLNTDNSSKSIDFLVKRGNKTHPIKYLSDGEKSRLGLCFIFAIRELLSVDKRMDFVVLDEIDRHLDSVGKQILCSELLPKLKPLYGTILVISHDEAVSDSIFDKVFTVVRKGGISELLLN